LAKILQAADGRSRRYCLSRLPVNRPIGLRCGIQERRLDNPPITKSNEPSELLKDGLRFFDEKLPTQPKPMRLLTEWGLLYQAKGDFDSAIESLQAARDITHDQGEYLERLSELYLSANQRDLAKDTLETLLVVERNSEFPYVYLARLFLEEDQPAESEALLRKAIYGGLNSHTIQLELAKVLLA